MSATAGEPQPTITDYLATGSTRAVAIVLPGGRADSFELTQSRHLSAVRMRPFARLLHRTGRDVGLTVIVLRYRYRGWNGQEMSPAADAMWALDEARARYGDVPVVLVGHSMGGRTGLRVAGHDSVRGVAALAPWLPEGEPVDQLAGREVLIAHGTLDRVTSPRASRGFAERARGIAKRVDYVAVRGDAHAMLLRAPSWHRLARDFALRVID